MSVDTQGKRVDIRRAKGRPMLSWVGKRPLRHVTSFPAQQVERFAPSGSFPPPDSGRWAEWPAGYPRGGLLFHGDNKEVLAHLLANGFRGKVNLIYIDPPFDSGADYVRQVQLRGVSGVARLDGEGYTLGEQVQYEDIWANDSYLQFMYERLLLLRELLAQNGSVMLHCDWHKSHHLRCVMDEVFGGDGFVNEVVWLAEGGGASGLRFGRKHQTIFYYTLAESDKERTFNGDAVRVPYRTENIKPQSYHFDANAKRRPGFKEGYTWTPNEAGKIPTDAWLDCFLSESEGIPLDVWYDVKGLYGPSGQLEEYPTQKPVALLERIIKACSNRGDIILDCFVGSGTTAEVAQRLGRRWIICDINKGAIQTTSSRLQAIILEQIEAGLQPGPQDAERAGEPPRPTQLQFSVYRVNDYDLQVQHNEAVALACERIGITRTRADSFFDGTLGKKLVKIAPFNHPITLLDLEQVKQELDVRPEEGRDVVVVGLGKETAVDGWLEDWNRLRKTRDVPNKIGVIELRTDPKYGGFIVHEPATARVRVQRVDGAAGRVCIEIEDFISPTIIERLRQQAGVLAPQIDDWRAMVDSVMIDVAYDGQVFNVALSDVPEGKSAFVQGRYELAAPEDETTVAVKVTDMLGEEVLVTERV